LDHGVLELGVVDVVGVLVAGVVPLAPGMQLVPGIPVDVCAADPAGAPVAAAPTVVPAAPVPLVEQGTAVAMFEPTLQSTFDMPGAPSAEPMKLVDSAIGLPLVLALPCQTRTTTRFMLGTLVSK